MTYARSDVKKPKADPQATVRRILGNLRVADDPQTFRCHVCQDQGFVELEPGTKVVMQSGARITVPEEGRGVVRVCDGGQHPACRYREWRKAEGAAKKAREGKESSGEGASL